jgi:hypothetical protein
LHGSRDRWSGQTAALVRDRDERQALVEFLKMQPGTLHVCLEEGTQSGWLLVGLGI